jgi:hypothetical protein
MKNIKFFAFIIFKCFFFFLIFYRFFFVGMTFVEACNNLNKHPIGTSIICLSENQTESFLSVIYNVAKGKFGVIKLERY